MTFGHNEKETTGRDAFTIQSIFIYHKIKK